MKKGFKIVMSSLIGAVIGMAVTYISIKLNKPSNRGDKFKIYYNTLNQWLKIKNSNKKLEDYFLNNNYKSVAIYGMGELGNRFYEEMKKSSIEVKYAIDQNAQYTYSDLKIYGLDDKLEKVDIVVVTAVFAYEEIMTTLKDKIDAEIISLEDIVFEV